jgi:hypothetical protein
MEKNGIICTNSKQLTGTADELSKSAKIAQ